MATASLFGQATTATDFRTDAPNVPLGVVATAHIAGSVTAIWWSPRDDTAGTALFSVFGGNTAGAGAALGSGTLDGYLDNNTWQRFPITPVPISLGADFMVDVVVPNGHYSFITGLFPTDNAAVAGVTGCFNGSGGTRPDSTSSLSYMVDFEFTYTAEVDGTGAAILGALSAAGAGVRTKAGAAGAALGAVAAAAIGSRFRTGAGEVLLGQLVATAAGSRARTGVGSAPLGALHAAGASSTAGIIHRPNTGTITRPFTGTITRP